MILTDVNVLIYAHRTDADDHERYRDWLSDLLNGDSAYGYSTLVLSGFLRIVTHPKIFPQPTPLTDAVAFADSLVSQPTAVQIQPGRAHWQIFSDLCRKVSARGNLVPDAYLAALAIENGCEWISTDRDFARFEGLTWRVPFER